MRIYRIFLISFIILCSFLLTGFKKTPKKPHSHHKEAKTSTAPKLKSLNLDFPIKPQAIGGDSEPVKPLSKNDTSELFDAAQTQKHTPVGLRGQVIQSQEPEAGKLKSADGAGIVFDFHP